MARVHGGTISDEEKRVWEERAREAGFDRLWDWIKWVIRQETKKEGK